MQNQTERRTTRAQKKLLDLLEKRQLRKWCVDNGFEPSVVFRIATGETNPTYKTACSMSSLIAPIEWLFYTDEQLPYEPQPLPPWDPSKPCAFVKAHKYDWKEIAWKYGLPELTAYNIFVAYRTKPNLPLIRKLCEDVNPTEFFCDGEQAEKENYIPERGDIVSVKGALVLVLSKKEFAKKTSTIVGCRITAAPDSGKELKGLKTKGFVSARSLSSFQMAPKFSAGFIERAGQDFAARLAAECAKIFS